MSAFLPADIGLPERFRSWRPGQLDAVNRALEWAASDVRALALCMPTGSGKSLVYMALAQAVGRTCVLTSTKGLQDQLLADFAAMGLVDIRGMNNYACLAVEEDGDFPFFKGGASTSHDSAVVPCDEGPCMGGFRCELNQSGCTYFDAKRRAQSSQLVVTNYSYWLRVQNQEEKSGLGSFEALILDEAHGSSEELASYLSVEIGAAELEELMGEEMPQDNENWSAWRSWAGSMRRAASTLLESRSSTNRLSQARVREIRQLGGLRDRLASIADARGLWVQDSYRDRRGSRKLRFDPVNVKEYRDALIPDAVPRVLFVSATVRPKTLDMLGLEPAPGGTERGSYCFEESTIAFPVGRRPVVYVPTVKMRYDMTLDQMRWWVTKIDQIIDKRLDVKGIVHTTSYKRAQFLKRNSRHGLKMVLPESATTRMVVADFIRRSSPGILVSPAVTTGFDFPGDACRFQIIGKIPFPDTRSKVLQAREKLDKDYGPYQAMQTVVQSAGRGMRGADDWCETFILDDNWTWFWARYRHFAPRWFQNAVRTSQTIPAPGVY